MKVLQGDVVLARQEALDKNMDLHGCKCEANFVYIWCQINCKHCKASFHFTALNPHPCFKLCTAMQYRDLQVPMQYRDLQVPMQYRDLQVPMQYRDLQVRRHQKKRREMAGTCMDSRHFFVTSDLKIPVLGHYHNKNEEHHNNTQIAKQFIPGAT